MDETLQFQSIFSFTLFHFYKFEAVVSCYWYGMGGMDDEAFTIIIRGSTTRRGRWEGRPVVGKDWTEQEYEITCTRLRSLRRT